MKTAVYKKLDGSDLIIEYDETAPCIICGEPVVEASVGGTAICPWCDMGKCRFCKVDLPLGEAKIREHMAWHRLFPY